MQDIHEYYLQIAETIAMRSTCRRRRVGCVIVDAKFRILSTGYNGAPSGMPHCTDTPCPGASAQSGERLESCVAIHAEQNACLFLKDPDAAAVIYCTTKPCVHCVKLLRNTNAGLLVYREEYAHDSLHLWEGRQWLHLP